MDDLDISHCVMEDSFEDAMRTAVRDLFAEPVSWNDWQKLGSRVRVKYPSMLERDYQTYLRGLSELRKFLMQERFGNDWLQRVPESSFAAKLRAAAAGGPGQGDGTSGAVPVPGAARSITMYGKLREWLMCMRIDSPLQSL